MVNKSMKKERKKLTITLCFVYFLRAGSVWAENIANLSVKHQKLQKQTLKESIFWQNKSKIILHSQNTIRKIFSTVIFIIHNWWIWEVPKLTYKPTVDKVFPLIAFSEARVKRTRLCSSPTSCRSRCTGAALPWRPSLARCAPRQHASSTFRSTNTWQRSQGGRYSGWVEVFYYTDCGREAGTVVELKYSITLSVAGRQVQWLSWSILLHWLWQGGRYSGWVEVFYYTDCGREAGTVVESKYSITLIVAGRQVQWLSRSILLHWLWQGGRYSGWVEVFYYTDCGS